MLLTLVVAVLTSWASGGTTGGHEAGLGDHSQQDVGETDAQPHGDLLAEATLKGTVVVP